VESFKIDVTLTILASHLISTTTQCQYTGRKVLVFLHTYRSRVIHSLGSYCTSYSPVSTTSVHTSRSNLRRTVSSLQTTTGWECYSTAQPSSSKTCVEWGAAHRIRADSVFFTIVYGYHLSRKEDRIEVVRSCLEVEIGWQSGISKELPRICSKYRSDGDR